MPYTDILKRHVDDINAHTRDRISGLLHEPSLLIVVANEDPASQSYVRAKVRAADALGIKCDVLDITDREPNYETKNALAEAYENYDAVIVQRPVCKKLEPYIPCVPAHKDVDGLEEHTDFFPCTPSGIALVLCSERREPADVVIVGRSDLVGRPLARMLTDGKFTVTLCHSKTKNLEEKCANADIVVCAVGKPHFLNYVPKVKDQLVIDVGITRVDGKLKGDVHPDVAKYADVTPVPGGVGPLTVAQLMNNVAVAASLNSAYELE